MSTVSGLTSNSIAANTSTAQARRASDADGDGDGRVHHGHHGQSSRGGGLAQQVMAALQSLGLNVTGAGKSDTSTTATAGTAASAGTGDSGATTDSSQASTLRQDLHEFMHQLFAAARDGNSNSNSNSNSGGGNGVGYGQGGRPGFAQGLAGLISEVSGGHAPAGLQSAFDKLTADLGAGATTGTGTGNAGVSLQALLTQLQGSLGYATGTSATGTTGATGGVVNSVA
jgi:hypothetical protein